MSVEHPGAAIGIAMRDRVKSLANVKVEVAEIDIKTLEKTSKVGQYNVVISPGTVITAFNARDRSKRTIRLEMEVAISTSAQRQANLSATGPFVDFLNKVQVIVDTFVATPITLTSPWGVANVTEEISETPLDDELKTTSMRFRQFTIPFNVNRSGV